MTAPYRELAATFRRKVERAEADLNTTATVDLDDCRAAADLLTTQGERLEALSSAASLPVVSPAAPEPVTGRLLCDAFAETFHGGGWADAAHWTDFDVDGQERWERAAQWLSVRLAPQPLPEGDGT